METMYLKKYNNLYNSEAAIKKTYLIFIFFLHSMILSKKTTKFLYKDLYW